MTQRDTTEVLGVRIDRDPLWRIKERTLAAIEYRERQLVFACANPHSLVVAESDGEFRAALNRADVVVADGVGVTLMGKWVQLNTGPRITGTDYFLSVMQCLQARGRGRVFFFGSSEKVLARIRARLAREYSNVELCGQISPPFGLWTQAENDAMLAAINTARPDVLWVGMTAPKQEKWVEANRRQLNVPVIGSIGAVFDFYAQTKPRAPQWMCQLGMEWLHRLAREPQRMWQRNFISTPKFVARVLRQHGFGRRLPAAAR